MDDKEYAAELAKIADALEAGQIDHAEWRRQMAELRGRRIEQWEREQESQGQEH